MIGLILLLVALGCYFRKDTRWFSYVLYVGFLLKGYVVLTDSVIGIKNLDLAIIYTFVICLYLLLNRQYKLPNIKASRWFRIFTVFLICSVLFSFLYYGFTPYQILQGGRNWLLIFSLPILIRMSRENFIRVIKVLAYITILTSIVYIAQIVVGRPLLPYDTEGSIDRSTGLIRLYNSPPLLSFFFVISFAYPELFKKAVIWRVLLFIALICTLGRTSIFATIIAVLIAIWLRGRASKLIKTVAVILILLIPFADIVTDRYEGGDTGSDVMSIVSGKYNSSYTSSEGGTMTYRLALLHERAEYLMHRPFSEQIFGMGFISDSQPVVHVRYKFIIGLINRDNNEIEQLWSPDIAWANMVSGLGFVGTIIYTIFFLSLLVHFYRNRNINKLYIILTAYMVSSLITSFSSSNISEPKSFAIYFMAMSTAFVFENKDLVMGDKEIDMKI